MTDTNNDGRISYDEFEQMINQTQSAKEEVAEDFEEAESDSEQPDGKNLLVGGLEQVNEGGFSLEDD